MDITQRQITKIAREVNRFTVRTLKSDGIGSSELDLIHTIRKHPGITQAKACAVLGADKGAVAKQCASLEAKGYIERKENPDDGRSRLLFPTGKAEKLKNSKAHIEALLLRMADRKPVRKGKTGVRPPFGNLISKMQGRKQGKLPPYFRHCGRRRRK